MKTPLSHEILDNWQLPEAPRHRLTVSTLLEAQRAAGRRVGLLLDLSNHGGSSLVVCSSLSICLWTSGKVVNMIHNAFLGHNVLSPVALIQGCSSSQKQLQQQHVSDCLQLQLL